MALNSKFLNSKLGRRIFFMFVCCALIPVISLVYLSFSHVTRQLNEQSFGRIKQSTKTFGMSLLERLMFLENDLRLVASYQTEGLTPPLGLDQLDQHLLKRFKGVYRFRIDGSYETLFGLIQDPPRPTPDQFSHMLTGKPVLMSRPHSDILSQIFLLIPAPDQGPSLGYIIGEVNPVPFWGIGYENKLPPLTELYALDQSNNRLISSIPLPAKMISKKLSQTSTLPNREFEFEFNGKPYIASYWALFLKPRYGIPNWNIVLFQSKSVVLAATAEFKAVFPQVVVLSLFVILLLSIIYIRKSLGPLESLTAGTVRVARRDFSVPVAVESRDEFADLAASFNSMSSQINRHFQALTTRSEIDRAILSSLDRERIIKTVLIRIRDYFTCDAVGFVLLGEENRNASGYYLNQNETAIHEMSLDVRQPALKILRSHPESFQYKMKGDVPFYLAPVADGRARYFLVLPLFLKTVLAGIIFFGHADEDSIDSEEIGQARQFADQAAIALSNSNLLEELHLQSMGTLEALARSVDAKSSWTAGHSERVTALALKIGKAMGMSSDRLNLLHQGGLMHDIGKIGVPVAILDKPGKLTDEEFATIKTHPSVGERILEPINTFTDLIPVVVQHHERFDGNGYPDRLAGDAICLEARIMSVADSYDAMTSDRPYRKGLSHAKAVGIIQEVSGTQLDPRVVKVFLEISDSISNNDPKPVAVHIDQAEPLEPIHAAS